MSIAILKKIKIFKQNEATKTVKVGVVDTVIRTIAVGKKVPPLKGHAGKQHQIGELLKVGHSQWWIQEFLNRGARFRRDIIF